MCIGLFFPFFTGPNFNSDIFKQMEDASGHACTEHMGDKKVAVSVLILAGFLDLNILLKHTSLVSHRRCNTTF